jgi:hypothetical protein
MRRPLFLLLVALPLSAALSQDATYRVITETGKPSTLEDNLCQLRDEIGGRVLGSPATQEAVEWGLDAFKKAGANSVDTKNFRLPVSWAEGAPSLSPPLTAFRHIPDAKGFQLLIKMRLGGLHSANQLLAGCLNR